MSVVAVAVLPYPCHQKFESRWKLTQRLATPACDWLAFCNGGLPVGFEGRLLFLSSCSWWHKPSMMFSRSFEAWRPSCTHQEHVCSNLFVVLCYVVWLISSWFLFSSCIWFETCTTRLNSSFTLSCVCFPLFYLYMHVWRSPASPSSPLSFGNAAFVPQRQDFSALWCMIVEWYWAARVAFASTKKHKRNRGNRPRFRAANQMRSHEADVLEKGGQVSGNGRNGHVPGVLHLSNSFSIFCPFMKIAFEWKIHFGGLAVHI